MADTANLALPLLQPAQAQKHVTVNEALVRLDGLTHLTLISTTETVPPGSAADGASYAVPAGAVNAWNGQAGKVAIWSNGGWVFVTPALGWRAWIADMASPAVFDGAAWVLGALGVSANAATAAFRVVEFDHVLTAGPSDTTAVEIPQYAMVFAVTGRIKTTITGSLGDWSLGVAGATDRHGSGLGLAQGSWLVGITGQPVTYWADTPLVLTANGGDFAAGEVRLALHYFAATPPVV